MYTGLLCDKRPRHLSLEKTQHRRPRSAVFKMSVGKECKEFSTDIFSEFLEVAIHTILYARGLYPEGVFVLKKKYNIPVQICRHPEVAKYITDLVTSVRTLLSDNQVRKVAVVILNDTQKPIERYIFELAPPAQTTERRDTYLLRLEQSLRAFLLKLNTCDSLLERLSKDTDPTWAVHVYTSDNAVMDLQQNSCIQDFKWIEADEGQLDMKDPTILPLKSMDSPVMKMQLYVEETSTKR